MDVDDTQSSKADGEKTLEWEFCEGGDWQELPANVARSLEKSWKDAERSVSFQVGSQLASADLDQMKLHLGLNTFPIRRKGDSFEVKPEALESLKAMGFSEDQAISALEVSGNDPEMAALWLMDKDTYEPEPMQSPKSRGHDDNLDSDVRFLPGPIQQVLSREVSGISPHDPVSVLDPAGIPEVSMESAGNSRPVLDEEWLLQLEREASGWKMKREQDLWQSMDEQLKDVEASSPEPPALTRSRTDAPGFGLKDEIMKEPREHPKLMRVSSAPPVMSGLTKQAWATLWKQARAHYAGATSS